MIAFSPCKINLGLYVIEKRPDGFHDLESIFYPVPFHDVFEAVKADQFGFQLLGMQVTDHAEDNLVVKAWRLLEKEFNLPPVQMALLKNIPAGAGLGGGSADAATCLKVINSLIEIGLDSTQLKDFAARLGSDCAFFIDNKPALATGRGEVLSPAEDRLKGWHLALATPGIHIGTAEAYRHVKLERPKKPLSDIWQMPVEEWPGLMQNAFEPHAFTAHPLLGDIKENFYEAGAAYASMTGSGSAIYGLFRSKKELPVEAKWIEL